MKDNGFIGTTETFELRVLTVSEYLAQNFGEAANFDETRDFLKSMEDEALSVAVRVGFNESHNGMYPEIIWDRVFDG